ncbi:SIMPL domain-containing protein [Micromonospora sp. LOL_023]|uniref:SIMPL domain-containing protein n=1 Tax=Micromonospora sp. LOL_023 TaxID=3345418 RepID=UPI003A8380AC
MRLSLPQPKRYARCVRYCGSTVAAARRKAELYAEAAGVRLGAVVHIDDVDPENVGHERYRGHGSGGQASAQDLAPGHVVVSAAVILGFSITHD